MEPHQSSQKTTYNTLMAMVEAHNDIGEALDPNGVCEALAIFYVSVYRAARWDEDEIVDHIADLVEVIVDGQGHPGQDDQAGDDGSLPNPE